MAQTLKAPALDPESVPVRRGSSYPEPFQAEVADRDKRRLGEALGLTRYGVNLVTLAPGRAGAAEAMETSIELYEADPRADLRPVYEQAKQVLQQLAGG